MSLHKTKVKRVRLHHLQVTVDEEDRGLMDCVMRICSLRIAPQLMADSPSDIEAHIPAIQCNHQRH